MPARVTAQGRVQVPSVRPQNDIGSIASAASHIPCAAAVASVASVATRAAGESRAARLALIVATDLDLPQRADRHRAHPRPERQRLRARVEYDADDEVVTGSGGQVPEAAEVVRANRR